MLTSGYCLSMPSGHSASTTVWRSGCLARHSRGAGSRPMSFSVAPAAGHTASLPTAGRSSIAIHLLAASSSTFRAMCGCSGRCANNSCVGCIRTPPGSLPPRTRTTGLLLSKPPRSGFRPVSFAGAGFSTPWLKERRDCSLIVPSRKRSGLPSSRWGWRISTGIGYGLTRHGSPKRRSSTNFVARFSALRHTRNGSCGSVGYGMHDEELPSVRARLYRKYATTHAGTYTMHPLPPVFASQIGPHLPPPGSSVLDLGCGQGALVRLLNDHGFAARGIDASSEQVALAQRVAPGAVEEADVFDFLNDCQGRFDAILAIDLLEHLTRSEVLRVLSSVESSLRG